MADIYFDIEKNTILEFIKRNISDIYVTDSITEDNSEVITSTIKETSVSSGTVKFDIIDYDRYNYGREKVPKFEYRSGMVLTNKEDESANLISYNNTTGEIEIASGFTNDIVKGELLKIKQENVKLYLYSQNPFYSKLSGSTSTSMKRIQFELSVDNDANGNKAQYYANKILFLFDIQNNIKLIDENGSELNKLLYINDNLTFDDEEVVGKTKIIYGSILVSTYTNRK